MGTSFPYLSNLMIKLTGSTKLDPDSRNNSNNRYNIKGFVVKAEIIKSRTAPAGIEFNMVFDQTSGFVNSLTDAQNLIDAGIITGRGSYELPGYDKKFRIKEVNDLYLEDEDFREALDAAALEYYQSLVPISHKIELKELAKRTLEINDDLTLELFHEDDEGSIWTELNGPEDVYYDEEGNQIEVEFD